MAIKSAPFSFIRFEHPDHNDVSLDIPYALPAFENHSSAFQFIVAEDRPYDQELHLGVSDEAGNLLYAFTAPAIIAQPKSYRYRFTNLLATPSFTLTQISINGIITSYGITVTTQEFADILLNDHGLDLVDDYVVSDSLISIVVLAPGMFFDGVTLNSYWHLGYVGVQTLSLAAFSTPDCFTYCLLYPDDSVSGYSNLFRITDEEAFTSLVEYWCNENSFGFSYTNGHTNIVRLPIYLCKPQFPSKIEAYRKSNGRSVVLSGFVEKEYEFETEQMPEVFHECMAIMLLHDNIKIHCVNIREIDVEVIESPSYNPQWENDETAVSKGKGKAKVATFGYTNSNC